jgi:hypothetical protein
MDTTIELKNASDFNPKCVNNFTNFLKIFFTEDKIEPFKDILNSQKAIVSGGSIVRSLFDSPENWVSEDIDIYVNAKNCIPLRNFLLKECKYFEIPKPLDDKGKVKKEVHTYTQSLFKRSKIIKIIRFHMAQKNIEIQPHSHYLHIDLMIVSNSMPLEDVIRKFDLSCCKVFYNGLDNTIKGLYLEDTIQYKAHLDKYFVSSLLNGSKKIPERLEKYKSRGFTITLDIPQTHVYGSYTKIDDSECKVEPEQKVKNKFFDIVYGVIFGTIFKTNYKLVKNYNLNLRSIVSLPSEEALLMCKSPKNENRVWSQFSHNLKTIAQKLEYQDDGYDREDFNSQDDYIVAGKEPEYTKVISYLKNKYVNMYNNHYEDEDKYHYDTLNYFCSVELPIFLKIMNVDISVVRSSYSKEFIDSLPENLECFVETEQDDFKVKEFLQNSKHIVIRSGENIKGYIRNEIITYIQTKGSFFTGEKIQMSDIDKLQDREYRIYELINTGLSNYFIIPHKTFKFLDVI